MCDLMVVRALMEEVSGGEGIVGKSNDPNISFGVFEERPDIKSLSKANISDCF